MTSSSLENSVTWGRVRKTLVRMAILQNCHVMAGTGLSDSHVGEASVHVTNHAHIYGHVSFAVNEVNFCLSIDLNRYMSTIYCTYASIEPWRVFRKFCTNFSVGAIRWN